MTTTSNQTMPPTQEMSSRGTRDLQAMMKEALSLYELARVASFHSTANPTDDLLGAIQAAQQAADDLLQKAGVAHLLGAPLQLNQGHVIPSHEDVIPRHEDVIPRHEESIYSADDAIVKAFAAAQLAYAEVRLSLLRLAELFTKQGRWQQAQKIAQPFLDNAQDPLHDEALNILRQTHYQPALVALQSGDLQKAQQELQNVLQLRPNEIDLELTRALIDAGLTDEAKQLLENWLTRCPVNANLNNTLCEIHYQLALIAIGCEEWEQAAEHIRSIWAVHPSYRDTRKLVRDNVLLLWRLGKVQCVDMVGLNGKFVKKCFSPKGNKIAILTTRTDSSSYSGPSKISNYLYILSPLSSEYFQPSFLEESAHSLSMKFVSESELLLFTSQYNSSTKTTLFKSISFDTRRKTFTNPQPIAKVPKEPKDSPNGELVTRKLNSLLILDSKSRNLVNKIEGSTDSTKSFFSPDMQKLIILEHYAITLWAPYLESSGSSGGISGTRRDLISSLSDLLTQF